MTGRSLALDKNRLADSSVRTESLFARLANPIECTSTREGPRRHSEEQNARHSLVRPSSLEAGSYYTPRGTFSPPASARVGHLPDPRRTPDVISTTPGPIAINPQETWLQSTYSSRTPPPPLE